AASRRLDLDAVAGLERVRVRPGDGHAAWGGGEAERLRRLWQRIHRQGRRVGALAVRALGAHAIVVARIARDGRRVLDAGQGRIFDEGEVDAVAGALDAEAIGGWRRRGPLQRDGAVADGR